MVRQAHQDIQGDDSFFKFFIILTFLEKCRIMNSLLLIQNNMFGPKIELTESEKIDFIYRKIRNRARMDTAMLVVRLAIFWWIIYFYVYMLPKVDVSSLIDKYAVPYMSKIVQMTAENTLKNAWGNMWSIDTNTLNNVANSTNTTSQWLTWSTQRRKNVPSSSNNWIKITPEMINAAKQIYNSKK